MSWYRGTEAPMDTSPAGPAQRTVFDGDDGLTWGSNSHPSTAYDSMKGHDANACIPAQEPLNDVEMSNLTPPSHKQYSHEQSVVEQKEHIFSDRQDEAPDRSKYTTSSVVPRIRRKRDALSRKGKRLAHLQSRKVHQTHSDGDTDMTDEEYAHIGSDDDTETDAEDTPSRIRSMTKYAVNYILPGGSNMTAVGSTSDAFRTPELLLGYAQLIFNASILGAFLYMLYHIIRTVQRDVAEKVRAYEMDTLSEITACASAYTANRCGTDLQAPALMSACKNWERCSARDPAVVGTARVTAETFAEILNGFVDSVSWKTMLFTLLSLSIVVGATNSTLSFFRIKSRATQGSLHSTGHDGPSTPAHYLQHQPHQPLAPPSTLPDLYPYRQSYPRWQVITPPAKQQSRRKGARSGRV